MPVTEFPSSTLGSTTGTTEDAAALIALAKLKDLCTIQRKGGRSEDGQGSKTSIWADYLPGVACRLSEERTEREILQAGVLVPVSAWTLEVPLGTDVLPTDQAIKDGTVYKIIDTNRGETSALLLKLFVVRGGR